MKKWILIFALCIAAFLTWRSNLQVAHAPLIEVEREVAMPSVAVSEPLKEDLPVVVPEKIKEIQTKKILHEVPFMSQAPTGNWRNLVFQNACEEASLLMADAWMNEKKFGTPVQMETAIRKITKEEEKYFPKDSYDLSVEDTLLLAQKYFPNMNISLQKDVTIDDMKNVLYEGKIIIIHANGQKLQNPNFTAPGPLYHALLIRGYDPVTDEFIVNDPGTRKGDGYRYTTDIVFASMQDYETGYHGKLFPNEKSMLVISK